MIPKNRIATHPGEVLLEEFLVPLDISQVKLAEHLKIPVQRVNEIVKGKRGISADTAWLLAAALGTSPEFWTNLQSAHDLSANRPEKLPRPMTAAELVDKLEREIITRALTEKKKIPARGMPLPPSESYRQMPTKKR